MSRDNQGQCQSHPRQPLPNLSSSTPLGFSVPEKLRKKFGEINSLILGCLSLITKWQISLIFRSLTNKIQIRHCRWCQICAQNNLKILKNGHLHSLSVFHLGLRRGHLLLKAPYHVRGTQLGTSTTHPPQLSM